MDMVVLILFLALILIVCIDIVCVDIIRFHESMLWYWLLLQSLLALILLY